LRHDSRLVGMVSLRRRWVGVFALLVAMVAAIGGAAVGSSAAAEGATVVAQQEQTAGRTVVVATKPLAPFVFIDGPVAADRSIGVEDLRGYSVDVWNEVADRLGLETQWIVRESVGDIINNAESGSADVAIAGISMTVERESRIDFTHPYFDAGLQIATTGKSTSSVGRTMWNLFTSRRLLGAVGFLMLMVIAISHAVWWSERKHNPEFPAEYREGIIEALWGRRSVW
jgi:ABC-type amino acid transport substrate-binding protein